MVADLLTRLFVLLLRLYPQGFRTEFEDEMQGVFLQRADDAAQQGLLIFSRMWLCELRHLLLNLWREHLTAIREHRESIAPHTDEAQIPHRTLAIKGSRSLDGGSHSWSHTLLVSIPFLLVGLGSIFATYLPYGSWQVSFGVLVILVLFGALGLAWVKGFPRWSYPYVMPLLGVALLGVVMTMVTGDPLNMVVPVLFLITVAAAVWLSGSIVPLRQLPQGIWRDWTLLAFAMYGLLGMAISLVFDDAHYNNLTPYHALAVLAGLAGALLYLRSTQAWQRMAALLGGATAVVLMGAFDQAHFFDEKTLFFQTHGWMLSFWVLLMVVIAVPALLVGLAQHLSARR